MHAVAATCPFVLFFVGFALRRHAVARVSCGNAVFRAGERVEPILRTGFLLPYTVDSVFHIRKRVHQERGCDGYKEEEMRTFSSSSFFSERCFRMRAVSSRLSALFKCFSCVIFHL